MYHKKKLALFISHIYGEYQTNLCQGVINQAAEYGYQTEIYATNDGENLSDYGLGEESILQIPDFSRFDGVLFSSETYTDPVVREKISNTLKKLSCPVIGLSDFDPDFPCVTLENGLTAGSLTEHLITVHNCRIICYLGSQREQFHSEKRLKIYKNTMRQHALEITPQQIYMCDESDEDYTRALCHFTEDGAKHIDGIVCYNDRTAIGLWLAAVKAGYVIPKDFAITGCDHSQAGQNCIPPLTTATFPAYELGAAAVSALIDRMQNKNAPCPTVLAEPVYGGSCGCSFHREIPSFVYSQDLLRFIDDLEKSMVISMQMSATFSHITDIDEGMDVLETYARCLNGCSEFYLCLYPEWDSIADIPGYEAAQSIASGDKASILLKLAVKNGRRLAECSFSRASLLPDYLQKRSDSSYVIFPLFFGDRAFGYLVLAFTDNRLDCHFHMLQWITNISQLLQNICQTKRAVALTTHLDEIHRTDSQTGLLNYEGFLHNIPAFLESAREGETLALLRIDIDGLGAINEARGWKEGDFALKTVSQAMTHFSQSGDLLARFGSDDFYLLLKRETEKDAKDFLLRVEKYISNYNRLNTRAFRLSICSGCCFRTFQPGLTADGLFDMLTLAETDLAQARREKRP